MRTCPYCKQDITGDLALPPMTDRQKTIYRAVSRAGSTGIQTSELLDKIDSPGPGGAIVLRVQVHALNRLLVSFRQRVRGSGGRYWLTDGSIIPKEWKPAKRKKKHVEVSEGMDREE